MTNKLNIALIQMVSGKNWQDNLERAKKFIHEAASNGAGLVVLPEFFIQITTNDDANRFTIAESLGSGIIQDELSNLAKSQGIYLLAGTIPLKSAVPDKFYNCSLLYASDGLLVDSYNKIHLFNFQDINNYYNENQNFLPGNEIVVCDVRGFKVGLAICYDLRFPEMFRAMGEVDAVMLPSAFTNVTGMAHWEVLIRARAIENQCYFVAVDQGGEHENGRITFGHSLVCDPWGEIIASCAKGEKIIYAALDKERIDEIRTKLPALKHRVIS